MLFMIMTTFSVTILKINIITNDLFVKILTFTFVEETTRQIIKLNHGDSDSKSRFSQLLQYSHLKQIKPWWLVTMMLKIGSQDTHIPIAQYQHLRFLIVKVLHTIVYLKQINKDS